jgi:proteasome lid subunit RPN8/RPN11
MNEQQLLALWNPQVERCGFILSDGEIVECPNVHENPEKGFEIPLQSITQYRDRVSATWHTHPATGPNLSAQDYKAFQLWPRWYHYIIGEREVWCFYVRNNAVILFDEDDLSAWLPEGSTPGADQGPRVERGGSAVDPEAASGV